MYLVLEAEELVVAHPTQDTKGTELVGVGGTVLVGGTALVRVHGGTGQVGGTLRCVLS